MCRFWIALDSATVKVRVTGAVAVAVVMVCGACVLVNCTMGRGDLGIPPKGLGEGGCHCLEGPPCGAEFGSDPFAGGATVRPSEVGVPLLHVAAPPNPVAVASRVPGVVRVQGDRTTNRGHLCHAEFDAFCVGEVDHGVLPC